MKHISTIKGRVYKTTFAAAGSVKVGSIDIATTSEPGAVYWKAPYTTAQVSDDYALTTLTKDILQSKPGELITTFSRTAPPGYIPAHGQRMYKAMFADLYEAIRSDINDTDPDLFTIPDTRGFFLRVSDDLGLDPEAPRALGSMQECGVPNITGEHGFQGAAAVSKSYIKGAFYPGGVDGRNYVLDAAINTLATLIKLDASRSSTVYQNDLTEVRPINIAVAAYIGY